MRAHARSLCSEFKFHICSIRQRSQGKKGRRISRPTSGRDLSALVTQGRAFGGLTRYGAEVAGFSSRGPRDPAVIPCNLIVSGKGRVQTTGDAATHSPLRTEWHHGLPMVADVLNRNHAEESID